MDFKQVAQKAVKEWFAYQNALELEFSMRVVSEFKPKVISEIGTAHNASLACWVEAANPELAIGIDPLTLPKTEAQQKVFDDLVKTYALKIIPYKSTQEEAHLELKKILGGRKIDFLYIDAEHGYGDVLSDFKDYLPYMNKPSLIGFNDIYFSEVLNKAGTGVWTLWERLKKEYNYDEIYFHSSMCNGFIYYPSTKQDNLL